MAWSKKDYEAVARIIRERREHFDALYCGCAISIQCALSAYFAADNPRFDAEGFAKACEPKA